MAKKPKRKVQADVEIRAALRSVSSAERAQPTKRAVAKPLPNHCKGKPTWTIYLNPEAKNALDELARSLSRKKNDLGEEAVNLLLSKYGKRAVA